MITFFFGGYGAHKFYVKKFGMGVLYLLFCWTMIPFIAAFIEFIIYIIKSEQDLETAYPDTLGAGAMVGVVIGLIIVGTIVLTGVFIAMGMMLGWEQGGGY